MMASMTSLLSSPSRNVLFALSLIIHLLRSSEHSMTTAFAFAFHTHHDGGVSSPALTVQSRVMNLNRHYAKKGIINGDDSKKDGKISTSKGRRRRKLVDRTSIFSAETSRTEPSSLFIDEDYDEEVCFLDDLPGGDVGQSCFVSPNSNDDDEPPLPFETPLPPMAMDLTLRYLPFVMPIFAYSSYESTARSFDRMVEYVSNNAWIAVDGGAYQVEIITPAINGLVVPSLALLFATLINNTINTLRQRQLQIRTSLNTEANDLRVLVTILDSLPSQLRELKNHLRDYLIQYASRVIAESKPGLSVDHHMYIGSMDIELNGFLRMWNGLSMGSYGTMYIDTLIPASNYTIDQKEFDPYQHQLSITSKERQTVAPFISPNILSETYEALNRLRKERSVRVSALQSTYPMLHYVILALLASSICTVFLMETNQDLLLFLSAIQLVSDVIL